MNSPHSLDVLFLTNFSDLCFRAIPAIAQMADAVNMRLTILHAYDPEKTSAADADAQIHSFFSEADLYPHCRRVAVPGPLLDVVRRHVAMWPVNLIVCPASDPIGLPRLGDPSIRAQLVEECGVPVWTIGRRVQFPKLVQPVRNVACWLDFHADVADHLPFAIDLAHKMGATLHLLRGIPEIHEGSLIPAAHQTKALHPELAAEEALRLCAESPVRPQVHVTMGHGRMQLKELLAKCKADVVFVRHKESQLRNWLGLTSKIAGSFPCPAVYVGNRLRVAAWNLQSGGAQRAAHAGIGTWAAEMGLG